MAADSRYCDSSSSVDSDDDFEKVSMECSESESGDKAIDDIAYSGHHMLNSTDTRPYTDTAQIVPFSYEVLKPRTVPNVSVPAVLSEACQQAPGSGQGTRSPLYNELMNLAGNLNQLMVRA